MQCLREVFSDKRFVCCAPTVLYNIYIYYDRSVHSLYIQPRWYIYLWSDRLAIDLPTILFIYTIYTTIACMQLCNVFPKFLYAFEPNFERFTEDIQHYLQSNLLHAESNCAAIKGSCH